jgi:hypothetical protein
VWVPGRTLSCMNSSESGGGLTDRDRAILAFEKQWWRNAGSKEQAIRERFQISATRYYQLLNALLDDEAALALEPEVVKRLRRLRAARQRARSGRVKRVADIGPDPDPEPRRVSNEGHDRDRAA